MPKNKENINKIKPSENDQPQGENISNRKPKQNTKPKNTKKALNENHQVQSESNSSESKSISSDKPKKKVDKALGEITNTTKKSQQNESFDKSSKNKLITDYFEIRKSTRRCKSDLEKQKILMIEEAILSHKEDGLIVKNIENKGRAIFTTRLFHKGDFICEYAGELISYTEAKKREKLYSEDETIGCYMFFFEHKLKSYCIDATAETNRLGRLINHSKSKANCHPKIIEIDSKPYLALFAIDNIKSDEELSYDYGDRNKVALEAHPWLNQ